MRRTRAGKDWIRLWTTKTWPPRPSSRSIASLITWASNRQTTVSTARRSAGGDSITDRSRIPAIAIDRVRGMGVAVSVSTWTDFRSCLSRSLCATPNRCSSSTTRSPRSLKATSLERSRWVPMTTSTVPAARPARTAFCCVGRPEAGEHLDPHRVGREALPERVPVLLGEDGGGHEDRHLVPVERDLEGRAHRDLGLAVAHVAADEPVHRLAPLEVRLHLANRLELVRRLLERERRLELVLPGRVGRRSRAPRRPAARRRGAGAPAAISRRDARTDSFVRCQVVAPSLSSRGASSPEPVYLVTAAIRWTGR